MPSTQREDTSWEVEEKERCPQHTRSGHLTAEEEGLEPGHPEPVFTQEDGNHTQAGSKPNMRIVSSGARFVLTVAVVSAGWEQRDRPRSTHVKLR